MQAARPSEDYKRQVRASAHRVEEKTASEELIVAQGVQGLALQHGHQKAFEKDSQCPDKLAEQLVLLQILLVLFQLAFDNKASSVVHLTECRLTLHDLTAKRDAF